MGWRRSRRLVVAMTACALSWFGAAQLADAARAVNTTIGSGPVSPTNLTTASFAFTASQGGATFTCKLDTGTVAACASPKAYAGLTAGSHTFSVYATKSGTSDPTPATSTWTIDLTAPTLPGGFAASAASSTSAKLTWTASTDNLAVGGYDVFRDGALLTSVGNVTTYTDATITGGSTHTYAVRARDTVGNVSALTTAMAVTTPFPPDTVIDTAPAPFANVTTASFTFHATYSGSTVSATFTCKLDTGTASTCTSPRSYTGLTQGSHTFSVYATDNAVNDPTPATSTWVIDTTAPSTPTGLTAVTVGATSASLSWIAVHRQHRRDRVRRLSRRFVPDDDRTRDRATSTAA